METAEQKPAGFVSFRNESGHHDDHEFTLAERITAADREAGYEEIAVYFEPYVEELKAEIERLRNPPQPTGVFAKTLVVDGRQILVYAGTNDEDGTEGEFALTSKVLTSFGFIQQTSRFAAKPDDPHTPDEVYAELVNLFTQEEGEAFMKMATDAEANFKPIS